MCVRQVIDMNRYIKDKKIYYLGQRYSQTILTENLPYEVLMMRNTESKQNPSSQVTVLMHTSVCD